MAGYGTDQGLTAYAEEQGYTLPQGLVPAARQQGSAYIDGLYGPRFPGQPTGGIEQERAWPRTGATVFGSALSSTVIPQRVIDASYEAAFLHLTSPGSLSRTFTPGEEKVLTEVKGIKWQVVGQSEGKNASVPVSTKIEGMIAPLLVTPLPAVLVV